jgi:NADH-quinone oxidoreductase subunit M
MNSDVVLLFVTILVPVSVGIAFILLGRDLQEFVRPIALLASLVALTTIVCLLVDLVPSLQANAKQELAAPYTFKPLAVPGDAGLGTDKPTGRTRWDLVPLNPNSRNTMAIQLYFGIDGLNVWLIALVCLLSPLTILASWGAIANRIHEYFGCILILQSLAICAFLSMDIIAFYVFFELTLIPVFFMIGRWGAGPERRNAARVFFLYTLAGSLFTFVGILGFVIGIAHFGGTPLTFSIPQLIENAQQLHLRLAQDPVNAQSWSFLQNLFFFLLITGFLVKTPLVPFHSWLPITYSEAPTAAVVFLSAILAKLGTYGFLRVVVPLAPEPMIVYGVSILGTLAIISIIYGAFCAYAQTDMKRLIAYSSISHLGFCVLGIIALNQIGLAGALLHMVNHGLTTGAMFLMVAMIFERYQSRKIDDYEGLASRMPNFTFYFIVFALASVGLPGLNNFVSELLILAGVMSLKTSHSAFSGFSFALAGAAGIVLGAWYTLTLLKRCVFGQLREPTTPLSSPDGSVPHDITPRELMVALPLASLCFVLGLFPQPFVDASRHEVRVIEKICDDARNRLNPPRVEPATPPTPTPPARPQRPAFPRPKSNQ